MPQTSKMRCKKSTGSRLLRSCNKLQQQPEALEERQLGDALRHTLHSAEATAVATNPAAVTEAAALATNAATGPAEATENGTNAATMPGNHGRSDSIVGVPSGRFFYFVAGQTPKLEQLIQEMQCEKVRW